MQIIKANPLNNEDLENLGLSWHTDVDNTPYVSDEIIEVSEEEAQKWGCVYTIWSVCSYTVGTEIFCNTMCSHPCDQPFA